MPNGWSRANAVSDGSFGRFNIRTGATSTGTTGPSGGNTNLAATATDCYIYAETSTAFPGRQFHLFTPVLDLSGYVPSSLSLQFDYHMYGSGIGTMHLDLSTDGGTSFTNDIIASFTNNSNAWVNSTVTTELSPYVGQTNVILRFRYLQTSSFNGDAALDNISITGQLATQSMAPQNIPIFSPIGLLAMVGGVLWVGRRRRNNPVV